jgi:FADH2 O2-dependent halogenase
VERFRVTRDENVYKELEADDAFLGCPFPSKAYDELFSEMVRLCDGVDHGELDSGEAGRRLMREVISSRAVLPLPGFQDPESRFVSKNQESFLKLARWIATEGPEDMRFLVDNPRIQAALNR